MIPSTKERKRNAGIFRLCYDDLCKLQNLMPLSGVKAHLMKNTLDFNGDRVKLEDWGPIVLSLGLDRSLHFIAVRSKHPAKRALEDVDTELKARTVTKRPVLLTRYILCMLMDALTQCLSNSTVLTCLELEGLPLGIDYLAPLCEGIAECKSLQNISFFKSTIGDEGCKRLCMIIRNLPNIISLDFSRCELTEKGAFCVAEMLKYQGLQRYNESWKQTLRYRTPNMEAMPGLRRVTLNHNIQIGDQGVMHLVDAVKEDLWLRALDLQNCGVGETGGLTVFEMLDINNSLHIVDLRGNRGIGENLLRQIMCKLAHNNTSTTHEYQWISLDPQLLKRSSTLTLVSRPSTYTCKSIRPGVRQSKPPISTILKPTLHRSQNVSFTTKNLTRNKTGIPWRVDVRMKQRQKDMPDTTPGAPQLLHNQQATCPALVNPPPSPCPSQLEMGNKMKLETLVDQLVKEVSLRKEAELQKEQLHYEVQRLVKELQKEQAEKEGFCLLKIEAFEAIQQTLDRFVDFMRNVKKARAEELLVREKSQDINNSEDEHQTCHLAPMKKSHSAHVKRNVSRHEQSKTSKSASVFYPENALAQNVEREIGDCLKTSRVTTAKNNRLIKHSHKSGSLNSRKSRTRKSQQMGFVSHQPRMHRSVPLISSGSLSGECLDEDYSSETESINAQNHNISLQSSVSGQLSKVQEIFQGLIQEQSIENKDEMSKDLLKKETKYLHEMKPKPLDREMSKDVGNNKTKYLNEIKPKPLETPSVSIKRHGQHSGNYGYTKLKECATESENDSDRSAVSKTWSAFSKSSTIHSQYSTDDDVY